jgi:hypothetical protein
MNSIDSKFRQVMPENPLEVWKLYIWERRNFFLAFLPLMLSISLLSTMQQCVYPVFDDAVSAEAFM